jgi:transposase
VGDWVRAYRKGGGLEALKKKPLPGRDRFLSTEQHEELRKALLEGASFHGFDSDLWTCPRIQALIERKFGIRHGISTIPRILRRLGFSPQKPEARAIERDERRIRGWVKAEWPRIKKRPEARGHARLRR